MSYGSREWLDAEYARSTDDPWGLDWRPSQQLRYRQMLTAIGRAAPGGCGQVLDIGCATGGFTARLAELPGVGAVTGTDLAAAAIQRARERHPSITFEQADIATCAERWPERFDLVTCLEVLYYLPEGERDAALAGIGRLLRPGGLLLVSSMIAPPPYFTRERLETLVASHLTVIGTGALALRQVNTIERLAMRAARLAGPWGARALAAARPQRLEGVVATTSTALRRLIGQAALSHGWVLAQRPR